MFYEEIYVKVKEAFEQSGIMFSPNDDDPVLSEYISDSIQYITAIVNIENALEIEVPDELLLPEQMKTLKSFSRALVHIVNSDETDEPWNDDFED